MKKYMIVMKDEEGKTSAMFTDDRDQAHNLMMDASCGMGYECEMYIREKDEDGFDRYIFLYA